MTRTGKILLLGTTLTILALLVFQPGIIGGGGRPPHPPRKPSHPPGLALACGDATDCPNCIALNLASPIGGGAQPNPAVAPAAGAPPAALER